jgi:hypothetical protein
MGLNVEVEQHNFRVAWHKGRGRRATDLVMGEHIADGKSSADEMVITTYSRMCSSHKEADLVMTVEMKWFKSIS